MFWLKALAFSAALTLAARYFCVLGSPDAERVREVSALAAQIFATMLGFVLAALAIVATVVNTRLLRNMLKTGHYLVLMQRMFGTVAICGIATLVSLGLVLLPSTSADCIYVVLGVVVLSTISLVDMSRKFWMVLANVGA